jgi:hypothetical protein
VVSRNAAGLDRSTTSALINRPSTASWMDFSFGKAEGFREIHFTSTYENVATSGGEYREEGHCEVRPRRHPSIFQRRLASRCVLISSVQSQCGESLRVFVGESYASGVTHDRQHRAATPVDRPRRSRRQEWLHQEQREQLLRENHPGLPIATCRMP